MKNVIWLGDSLNDLEIFPSGIRREAGYQLFKVQDGGRPADWKPMNTIGMGVEEMRLRDETGAFRVVYYARRAEAVYVLHVFQKKTQQTSLQDIRVAKIRFLKIEG